MYIVTLVTMYIMTLVTTSHLGLVTADAAAAAGGAVMAGVTEAAPAGGQGPGQWSAGHMRWWHRGLLPVIPTLGGGALLRWATLAVTGRLHSQGQVLIEADREYCHGLGAEVTAGQA